MASSMVYLSNMVDFPSKIAKSPEATHSAHQSRKKYIHHKPGCCNYMEVSLLMGTHGGTPRSSYSGSPTRGLGNPRDFWWFMEISFWIIDGDWWSIIISTRFLFSSVHAHFWPKQDWPSETKLDQVPVLGLAGTEKTSRNGWFMNII